MNTNEIFSIIQQVITFGLLIYGLLALTNYSFLAIASSRILSKYKKENPLSEDEMILSSPITPAISLIAPAFNESRTIIENVRSLLSLRYPHLEVIIVNDGSTDDTLEKMLKEYEMVAVDNNYSSSLKSNNVTQVYRSTNPALDNLIVIDKENGGKSDALNAGINISNHGLIACVDVDCIMANDALLRLVKPFIKDDTIIASGGFLGIANSCKIEGGKLVEVNVPQNYIARAQVLEYLRSFLLSRMAWVKLDGMMLISGAFGLFNKDTVIACGGYDTSTVGEDMELLVRMRRWKRRNKQKYKVSYIPDPMCWTEGPDNIAILSRQRTRWARGLVETLWKHKRLLFGSRHFRMSWIAYPYWLLFEWLEPFVEFFGLLLFIFVAFLGFTNWTFFFTLMLLIYSFVVMYALFALLAEELMYHQYNKREHIRKLFLTALLEPFYYHPINVYYAIKGNMEKWLGVGKWGKMTRTGFGKEE